MAQTKYEYVKKFETKETCLLHSWIVIRIDGKNFHKFSDSHNFQKPNDKRALDLMAYSATSVLQQIPDILMAYGESDEFSFVFNRKTRLYNRRSSKLLSEVCSLFTASYVYHWSKCFEGIPLLYPPSFDARLIIYPTNRILRDYLSWRQADCHINNLYNTCFWSLVQLGGHTRQTAEKTIRHTVSAEKHEILFNQFHINYNNEPEQFKKGTFICRKVGNDDQIPQNELSVMHCDIIGDEFWNANTQLLTPD